MRDYLLEAKMLQSKIESSITARAFSDAWQYTQDLTDLYIAFVNSKHDYERTPDFLRWANGLVNSPSQYRAEILSKEGKHKDALLHATWKAVTENRPIKKYEKKMMVYLRRSKLNIEEADFYDIYLSARASHDIGALKRAILAIASK